MTQNNVLDSTTGAILYLDLLGGGSRMLVHTRNHGAARTNIVAELRKESDDGDWLVVDRPATADPSLIKDTWRDAPNVVISQTIAEALAEHDLWADVTEVRN